jgi:DNA polymerase III alpha subunit
MEFAQICKANGIRPITGAELTIADPEGGPPHHLTLLAADRSGYSHLCRLITRAYAHDRLSPALDPSLLAEHAGGLICLSGCRKSRLARLVSEGRLVCGARHRAGARSLKKGEAAAPSSRDKP